MKKFGSVADDRNVSSWKNLAKGQGHGMFRHENGG